MDHNLMIDFNRIIPNSVDSIEEKIFFAIFRGCRKVIYDWGYDKIIVKDEQNKDHFMTGEDFINRTMVDALSAADIVVVLFVNGKDVEIINWESTFKTKEEKDEYMESYYESAKTLK